MRRFFTSICMAAVCLLAACAPKPVRLEMFMLDTFVTLTVYGSAEALNNAYALCEAYEEQLSRTRGGDVARVNAANGVAVQVLPETAALLQEALAYSWMSGGFFDITIGKVSALWDFTSGEDVLPHADDIEDALAGVGYENIVIDGNSVRLTNGAQLDLGAIAKGYISDRVADSLRDAGVAAVVSLGGNIVTVGNRPGGEAWAIAVRKPFAPEGENVGVLRFRGDRAVVTTGVYERSFTLDGVFYHHILDPVTGYSAVSDLASVTVLHASGMAADALGTVVFGMGADKGLEFLNKLPGTEGVLITMDGEILTTTGFGDDIQFTEQ